MIILKVRNGIGNQLFVLALGEYFRQQNPNQIVKYDLSELPLYVNGRYTLTLDSLSSEAEILSPDEVRRKLGKVLYRHRFRSNDRKLVDAAERKLVTTFTLNKSNVFVEENTKKQDFVDFILNYEFETTKDYVFDGYWENIKYVERIRDILKSIIDFPGITVRKQYIELLGKNLVSVHIRRGDYIKESFSDKGYPRYFYAVCDEEYYKKAIESINGRVENPLFLFFSDDIEYVKQTYSCIENKVIVEGQRDVEDLFLMTKCKHHILANSTFSFWGAYLANGDGINIAPTTHYYRLLSPSEKLRREFFKVPGWIYLDGHELYCNKVN